MTIPKIACINDISGLGRCSLTTAISILSTLSCQPCPAPTSILSKQTGFDDYYFFDMENRLDTYLKNWSDTAFDGIYTGFFGSTKQIDITLDFIENHENDKAKIIIDPVMGDDGELYPVFHKRYCSSMKNLISIADIITPNVTEACLLSDTKFNGNNISIQEAKALAQRLKKKGCQNVVITGIKQGDEIITFVLENSDEYYFHSPEVKTKYSGMGDLFSSIITGLVMQKNNLKQSVKIASDFLYKAMKFTEGQSAVPLDGIAFEPLLNTLSKLF